MVKIVACRQWRVTLLLKEGHTLLTGMQKDLFDVFPIRGQPQYFGVKLLRSLNVVDVEHDVVHPTRLDHSSLLGLSLAWIRYSGSVSANRHSRPTVFRRRPRYLSKPLPRANCRRDERPKPADEVARSPRCPAARAAASRWFRLLSAVSSSGPPFDAQFWTRWCPESDLNQRPTSYEAVLGHLGT